MIVELLVYTAIAFVSPRIVPGVRVQGIAAAVLVALVFGLLNFLIGWLVTFVLTLLSLPFYVLSLGLFKLVIPTLIFAVLLRITDAFLEPFELDGWKPALIMALLFSIGSFLTSYLL